MQVNAQGTALSARIVDADNDEALVRATSQLYRITTRQRGRRDTVFVSGQFSDGQGHVTFNNVKAGSYLLRVSFLGYKTVDKQVKAEGATVALGTIRMQTDAQQVAETVVTANLP